MRRAKSSLHWSVLDGARAERDEEEDWEETKALAVAALVSIGKSGAGEEGCARERRRTELEKQTVREMQKVASLGARRAKS